MRIETDFPTPTTEQAIWGSPICVGWKEIGIHMRCSEATARSRAKKHNLSIYKPVGCNKPIAFKADLDQALIEIARQAQRLSYGRRVLENEE